MKKIKFLFCLAFLSTNIFSKNFTNAISSGYVFKHDCAFKDVYGHGVVNVITVDECYYHWELWGIGAKVSYWRAKGQTTFLKQCTILQEIPITFYLRRIKNFECGLQIYGSIGGGLIWLKEKSYLGTIKLHKGVGEIEVGSMYPIWRCINVTTAFRYLFPNKSHCCTKINVGGVDLRAGIEFSF